MHEPKGGSPRGLKTKDAVIRAMVDARRKRQHVDATEPPCKRRGSSSGSGDDEEGPNAHVHPDARRRLGRGPVGPQPDLSEEQVCLRHVPGKQLSILEEPSCLAVAR